MNATLDRLLEWPGISRRARIARKIRGGGGSPVYNFTHYRFRSGDTVGLNVDSGWIAAEDTDTGFTLEIGKVYRLRVKISETGDKGSNNQPIHIQARHNEVGVPSWQDVNVCGNGTQEGPVQMWVSEQYSDGAATSELLTNDGGGFLAGTGSEDNAEVTSIDASETEFEYCFQIMSSYQGYQIVEPGDTISFRVVLGAIGSSTAFTGTENIPTVTVAASTAGYIGGCHVEGPNRIGPFCDSNGALYYITEYAETANDVVVWKSTDGGASWSAQDVLNRPTENDWECADVWQEGDTLYILLSTGSISFHSFRMSDHPTNPDTWDITDEDVDSTIAGHTSQSGALVRRSDGTFVALYQDDSTPDRIRYKIRSSGGSWGSQQTVDTEASVDFTGVRAVLGASDTTHIFYKDDTNGILYWRTLSSGDSLSGRTALYSSLEATSTHDDMPILPPVYWDDGGTSKVLVCFQVAENGSVRSVLITGGTPASDVAAFDNTVATDAGSSHMYQATLAIDPATNISYGLYANAATLSLYRAEYDPSTGWGSDTLEDSSQDYHWVCARVFTHSSGNGGAKVLGYGYDSGSGGGTGRVYYGEYEIPTAGRTGSLSKALPFSLASAGSVLVAGALSAALPLSLSAAAAVDVVGDAANVLPIELVGEGTAPATGNLSEALPLALAADGLAVVGGALSQDVPLALGSAGSVDIAGELTQAVPLSLSATGAVEVTGALSDELPLSLDAVGSSLVERTADLSQDLPLALSADAVVLLSAVLSEDLPLALTAAGVVDIAGSLAQDLPLTLASTGAVDIAGGLSQALPLALTATGSASAERTGNLAEDLPLALAASGAVDLQGAASNDLPLTLASDGAVLLQATAVNELPLTLAAAAALEVQADAANELPLSLAADGTVVVAGACANDLPLALSGTGSVDIAGGASNELPLSLIADGTAPLPGVNGELSEDLPLALTGSGSVLTQGTLAKSLPLALAGAGRVEAVGGLSAELPLGLAAAGAVEIGATASNELPLALSATGTAPFPGRNGYLTQDLPLVLSAAGVVVPAFIPDIVITRVAPLLTLIERRAPLLTTIERTAVLLTIHEG